MEDKSQFLQYTGEHPPYDRPRKPRGCVFYGCAFAAVLGIFAVLLFGLALFFGYRALRDFVQEYGEETARPIPVAEIPADRLEALQARVAAFRSAIEAGSPAEPLVLTAEELNALIDTIPEYKGVFAVDLAADKIRGDVSLPLAAFGFPGRFLNGTATFDVRIDRGLLIATIDALEVKGKAVPSQFLAKLREQNLARDANLNPKNAAQVARIESVAVKDGKLIISPKSLAAPSADEAEARPVAAGPKPKPDGAEAKPEGVEPKPEPAGPKPPG